jgi:S-adenosylmethionine synthetase
VNGLISLHRPMSTEAAAGKNPVSHVGKIYNLLAHQMAMRIYESIGELEEVNVWLCSQIGRPVADPWSVAVEMIAESEASARDFGPTVTEIVQSELDGVPRFLERLVRGELPVC